MVEINWQKLPPNQWFKAWVHNSHHQGTNVELLRFARVVKDGKNDHAVRIVSDQIVRLDNSADSSNVGDQSHRHGVDDLISQIGVMTKERILRKDEFAGSPRLIKFLRENADKIVPAAKQSS